MPPGILTRAFAADPVQVVYSIEQLYRQPEFRGLRSVSADELLDRGPLGLASHSWESLKGWTNPPAKVPTPRVAGSLSLDF